MRGILSLKPQHGHLGRPSLTSTSEQVARMTWDLCPQTLTEVETQNTSVSSLSGGGEQGDKESVGAMKVK